MFAAFCDAIENGNDDLSGGPPQLVGLKRKGPAQHYGIHFNGQSSICGVDVSDAAGISDADWYNELFERCDTDCRIDGAQQQPRPLNAPEKSK
ncbi:MAG: hypothetical protein Fues2KO_04470 [Fuerstiella sp.]